MYVQFWNQHPYWTIKTQTWIWPCLNNEMASTSCFFVCGCACERVEGEGAPGVLSYIIRDILLTNTVHVNCLMAKNFQDRGIFGWSTHNNMVVTPWICQICSFGNSTSHTFHRKVTLLEWLTLIPTVKKTHWEQKKKTIKWLPSKDFAFFSELAISRLNMIITKIEVALHLLLVLLLLSLFFLGLI